MESWYVLDWTEGRVGGEWGGEPLSENRSEGEILQDGSREGEYFAEKRVKNEFGTCENPQNSHLLGMLFKRMALRH